MPNSCCKLIHQEGELLSSGQGGGVRGLELTSSHRHTKMTAIYRETIDKNNQKMGRKGIKDLLMSFYLSPNYGGGNEDNVDLLQIVPCMHCYTPCPQPCSRPPPTHASAGDSWTLTGKSGVSPLWGHCSFLLGPGAFQEPISQSCVRSGSSILQEGLCHTQVDCTQSPWPCGSPLLTCTSTGDTQTQFCLRLCGVSGSSCIQVLSPLSISGGNGV